MAAVNDKLTARNREFKGLSINSGKVMATVCLYSTQKHKEASDKALESDADVEHELTRFREARAACSADLDNLYKSASKSIGKAEAEIFVAQKHIMNDPAIVETIETKIRDARKNLERTIIDVFGAYEEKFARLNNEYLRQRSSDIGEIRQRLLDHLYNERPGFKCEGQGHCRKGKDRVIVAEELTAEMMVRMDLENVMGIVTEHGGISSHAAIIARSVGVPAVSGVRGIFDVVSCGSRILVDGDRGVVIVEPDQAVVDRLIATEPVQAEAVCILKTPEGMELMANASLLEDVHHATAVQADGIGLLRTEIAFMRAGRLLGEDEQYAYYSEVRNAMGGRPVTFRLLDVGGDKELPFLKIVKESNPYLGWRGARFLLGNPDILAPQVRAMLRLSKSGKVRILIPMVVDLMQLEGLLRVLREMMQAEGTVSDNVSIGAMFEVPSACLQAERILRRVDFGSIGSNDLIQYLFAVDRNNERVSRDYDPNHPVLWDILKSLSAAAKRTGRPLSICGEMAGRESMPARLLDIGIVSLSVSSRLIPRVRNEMSTFAKLRLRQPMAVDRG